MRVTKRHARERLQRLRTRAYSARTGLAAARVKSEVRSWLGCPAPLAIGDCADWKDNPPGRRTRARIFIDGEIAVRRLGGFTFEVRLDDVSAAGCKIELIDSVEANDHVIARLPGLEPFGARVTWADAHSAGLNFDRPMHPAVFELLLQRLG